MMKSYGKEDLLNRFTKIEKNKLTWLSRMNKIQALITEESKEPQNMKECPYNPNDFIIHMKHANHKRKNKEVIVGKIQIGKSEVQGQKKVYKPGTFALFYELNEGCLQKDKQVWYYKSNKDIVGPASSYNMDKMVYYKKINDDTRVAFQTIDKFIKFGKIRKVVQNQHPHQND